MKRKIVLKRNNTNIILYGVLGGVIFGIVAIPIINYLVDSGLRSRYAHLAGIGVGHLTAWTILYLTVEFEPKPKPFDIPKGLVVAFTVLGFLAIYVAAIMRQIFLACYVALLIIGLWAWEIHKHRKTPKKNRLLVGEKT